MTDWVDRDLVLRIVVEEVDKGRTAAFEGRPEALPVVLARLHKRLENLRITSEMTTSGVEEIELRES